MQCGACLLTLAGLTIALHSAARPPLDVVDPWKREASPELDHQDPWKREEGSPTLDHYDPWDESIGPLSEIRDPWRDRSRELGRAVAAEDPWARDVPTAAFPPAPLPTNSSLPALPTLPAPRGPIPTAAFPLL